MKDMGFSFIILLLEEDRAIAMQEYALFLSLIQFV
jgi:hypothetical protein